MTETFRRLSEIQPAESTTTLIYGGSGSGKTTFIGTAGSRTVIIDNGKGIDAIQSPYFKANYPDVNPLVKAVRVDWDKEIETALVFDAIKDAVEEALNDWDKDFDTIALDDSTTMRRGAMYKALEIGQKLGRSGTKGKATTKDALIVEVQDYGVEQQLIMQFLVELTQACKKYKKHLLIGAHVRAEYSPPAKIGAEPTIRKIRPGFTGRTFPDDVVALFDNCWYFEKVGASSYRMLTQGDDITTANTSMGGVLEVKESNPNFSQILKRLQEAKAFVKVPRK